MSRRHNGTLQHDNRDCGAACLATILHRYKLEVPLVHIREKMHTNRNGASIYDIINTAEKYNLQGNALHGNWQDFESSIRKGCVKLPLIAHLTNEDGAGHFVVVDKISSGSVKGFDPASGEYKWSFKEFCHRVLFLCEGRIEAFGPHENIMNNSKAYNELVNAAY